MQLHELGEFGLIDRIRERFRDLSDRGCRGIGDDCAVMPCGASQSQVVTTDMLIEEVHFLRDIISPYQLGRKSLAVNLSDVAAMGAEPIASFLSIALPQEIDAVWAEQFIDGYKSLSAQFGVPLLGGDTTSSRQHIAINVTAIGRAANAHLKYRSSAQPGDRIFVTGYLGDSAQGLRDIQAGRLDSPFIALHHDPTPRVHEGVWLGKEANVHAMMDISDGLASDLTHILKASGVGAELFVEKIPTHTSIDQAVTGGEDYELLLTLSAKDADRMAYAYAEHFQKPLYEVGRICTGFSTIRWIENGTEITPDWHGFTHF